MKTVLSPGFIADTVIAELAKFKLGAFESVTTISVNTARILALRVGEACAASAASIENQACEALAKNAKTPADGAAKIRRRKHKADAVRDRMPTFAGWIVIDDQEGFASAEIHGLDVGDVKGVLLWPDEEMAEKHAIYCQRKHPERKFDVVWTAVDAGSQQLPELEDPNDEC